MKISLDWLRTLLDHGKTADQLSELLTGAGLEVENREVIESVKGGLKGLVVGEVLECAKHPDADRLSVTRVNVGNGNPLSIVCGAPNVAAGQKVIVAKPGTRLFPLDGEPFEIKKSKIRGQVSEGMICAEDEIGIGKSHEGIIVLPPETEVGQSAAGVFKLESDEIFEIGLTPNRGDAASHYGVARDLAALLNCKEHTNNFRPEIPGETELPEPAKPADFAIDVTDKAGCPRYCGILIRNIKVTASPGWLQKRLNSIGVRPINNVVDITNFVLHEIGQPLHAFDADKIKGSRVVVRRAAAGEKFVTLDGVERSLTAGDLMICDEKVPMCIAGVFGGATSGVTEKTTAVFLESAYFDPASIRRSARHHGLRTDASFRFERGVDPEMTGKALIRAANLILEIAGGTVATPVIDVYPEKIAPHKVAFSYKNCNELVGKELDRAVVKSIILSLGITIDSEGTDGLLLLVPAYKHDVNREADVIEEVLRIYGYDHVEPAKHISFGIPAHTGQREHQLAEKLSQHLVVCGFTETMGLSLSNASYYNENAKPVKVLNPLSNELGVMRADMVFSGLEAIAHNINRQSPDLRLFELGRIYSDKGSQRYEEKKQLALFVTGAVFPDNPYGFRSGNGFACLRGALDSLFAVAGIKNLKAAETDASQFGFGLEYKVNGRTLATFGSLAQPLLKKFDIGQPVFYACVEWDQLLALNSANRIIYAEVPRFPAVKRDLALLLDKNVRYSDVEELAFKTEKKLLTEVALFDIYEDAKLAGRKSYAVRFTLQDPDATLTDKQIDGVMERLIRNYREKLGAELR